MQNSFSSFESDHLQLLRRFLRSILRTLPRRPLEMWYAYSNQFYQHPWLWNRKIFWSKQKAAIHWWWWNERELKVFFFSCHFGIKIWAFILLNYSINNWTFFCKTFLFLRFLCRMYQAGSCSLQEEFEKNYNSLSAMSWRLLDLWAMLRSNTFKYLTYSQQNFTDGELATCVFFPAQEKTNKITNRNLKLQEFAEFTQIKLGFFQFSF